MAVPARRCTNRKLTHHPPRCGPSADPTIDRRARRRSPAALVLRLPGDGELRLSARRCSSSFYQTRAGLTLATVLWLQSWALFRARCARPAVRPLADRTSRRACCAPGRRPTWPARSCCSAAVAAGRGPRRDALRRRGRAPSAPTRHSSSTRSTRTGGSTSIRAESRARRWCAGFGGTAVAAAAGGGRPPAAYVAAALAAAASGIVAGNARRRGAAARTSVGLGAG